ncbi:MAG TPA: twin-arginine translocase TatA/TatE family subunit, partial [Terriglobales bacterium]
AYFNLDIRISESVYRLGWKIETGLSKFLVMEVYRRSKSWDLEPKSCSLSWLGFLFVGPKRLPTILGQIARAKARLESATRTLEAELEANLEPQRREEHGAARTTGEQ